MYMGGGQGEGGAGARENESSKSSQVPPVRRPCSQAVAASSALSGFFEFLSRSPGSADAPCHENNNAGRTKHGLT